MSSYPINHPSLAPYSVAMHYPVPFTLTLPPNMQATPQPQTTRNAPFSSNTSSNSTQSWLLPLLAGVGLIGLATAGITQREKLSRFFSVKPTPQPIVPKAVRIKKVKAEVKAKVSRLQPPPANPDPILPTPPQPPATPTLRVAVNNPQKKKKQIPFFTSIILGTGSLALGGLTQVGFQTAKLAETLKPAVVPQEPIVQTVKAVKNTCLNSIEAIKTRKTTPLKARTTNVRMAWLRSTEQTEKAVCEKIKAFQAMGFNGVLLETVNGGSPNFPSETFDAKKIDYRSSLDSWGRPKGTDLLKWWVDIAHKLNETEKVKAAANPAYKPLPPFEVHAWANIFYAGGGEILNTLPQWGNRTEASVRKKLDPKETIYSKSEDSKAFLDPANPEVRTFIRGYVKEIEARHPDGINLDYIRYPTAKPAEQWGFTQSALQQFKAQNNGESPLENPRLQGKWEAFKTAQVNALVQGVSQDLAIYRSNGGMLSAAIFPNQAQSLEVKNQQWSKWAKEKWTDCLFPMNYTKDPSQFKANVREVKRTSACTVPVNYVRYQEKPKDYEDTQGRYLDQEKLSQEAGSNGVSLFGVDLMKPKLIQALQQEEQARREQGKQKQP